MKTPLILGHFILAATHHHEQGPIQWHAIDKNSPVHLQRERFNPHDPLCISLRLADDTRIGYIRREDNRVLSALIDQDASLSARIVELTFAKRKDWPTEVRIEVALEG